jgi:hypothetical protein
VGEVAERLEKTLMRPLFSATKTRPSGEKRTTVGFDNPEKTTDSENPGGNVAPSTIGGVGTRHPNTAQIPTHIKIAMLTFLILPPSEHIWVAFLPPVC